MKMQLRDSFKFFFELETRRKQDMENSGNSQTALDRSIYTLLAFEVGASRLTGINILPWAIEYLEEHRDEIIIPEQVVYMDVPAEVSRKRATEGNIPIAPFLLTDEFNSGFRDFFVALKEKAPDLIDIVDATKEPEEINLEVSNLVSGQDSI
jgi:thymidylate kinase